MTKECKCAVVASIVLKDDAELCQRCRLPLSAEEQGQFDEALADSRETSARVGKAGPRGSLARDNDPDWVPPEHRSRDPRHDASLGDREIEKAYADHAEEMRSRGTGKTGRLVACIPPELKLAKERVDKDYWKDPKNMRKHRDFLVHE
jgi:hypothetical protein